MKTEYKLKHDGFRKVRGGSAKVLDIICAKCKSKVLVYQKDGLGFLHRCYLNRILEPEEYASLQSNPNMQDIKNIPALICKSCGTIIGTPIKHTDKRLAFILRPGFFIKKLHKA